MQLLKQNARVHPSAPAGSHTNAPASHVSQCVFVTSLRYIGREGGKLSCRIERQKRQKVLRERENE